MNRIFSRALATSGAMVFVTSATALPTYFKNFQDHYSQNKIDVSQLAGSLSCQTCHESASPRLNTKRNGYGRAVEGILSSGQGFPSIEFSDSDGDGFVNLEEIFLQVAPGDASAAPAGRIALEKDANRSELIVVSLPEGGSCAALEIRTFGFKVQDASGSFFDEVRLTDVASGSNLTLDNAAAKGALLAKCASDAWVGSLQL